MDIGIPMNIAFIITSNAIGGTERRFANLFTFLSSNSPCGYHYSLILPEGLLIELCRQEVIQYSCKNVIRIFHNSLYNVMPRVKVFGFRVPMSTILLTPALRCEWYSPKIQKVLSEFDVLHFALPEHPVIPIDVPKRKAVILEEPNSGSNNKPNQKLLEWLNRGAYMSCLTETIAKSYKTVASVEARERIFTAPCSFIDYTRISIAPKERLILFVGRMEKCKNPELFVSTIEMLAKRRNDFRAIMLGTGRLDRKIDSLIRKKGLGKVLSRYYTPNPMSIMSRASIFVSIQEHDNYPSQALIEAMASGCAVIASERGETKKLVTEETGFVVPLSAKVISERIDQMLDQFDTTVLMGEQSRQKVMQEHTITKYVSYLEDIYAKVFQK